MNPLCSADRKHAVPFERGPGHRMPQTMLLIDERDKLLIEAARRFCIGMSDRQAAHRVRTALLRHQAKSGSLSSFTTMRTFRFPSRTRNRKCSRSSRNCC
jgi:hypothetical protein